MSRTLRSKRRQAERQLTINTELPQDSVPRQAAECHSQCTVKVRDLLSRLKAKPSCGGRGSQIPGTWGKEPRKFSLCATPQVFENFFLEGEEFDPSAGFTLTRVA